MKDWKKDCGIEIVERDPWTLMMEEMCIDGMAVIEER